MGVKMEDYEKDLLEICGNCGFTFGSHHGGTSSWLYYYCPGNEGRMDWDKGPGTVFKSTGEYLRKDNA